MPFRLTCLAFVVSLALSAGVFAAEPTQPSLAEVKKAVDSKQAVLVDVREKREWDSGHIENAVLVPSSELRGPVDTKWLKAKLPADKVLYTYCVVGKRAQAAANILEKHGYEVRSLKPGYKELLEAGFPKAKD